MAFIPVPNCVEVFLQFAEGTLTFGFRLHFEHAAGFGEAEMDDLAAELEDWRATELISTYANSVDAELWRITDVRTETGMTKLYTITTNKTGTATGAVMPTNIAAVVSHRTGLRGRSYRGRTYMPGLTEAQVTYDQLESAYQVDLLAAFAAIASYTNPVGWYHVVVSKYTEGAPRTTAVATPVTSYYVDDRVDTQRRRLPSGYVS